MKKKTLLILTLISIIAMVAGTAMTTNASAYTLSYLGAHLSGKQMVFTFSYEGNVPNSVLQSATAAGVGGSGDGSVTLDCVKNENKKQIRCTVGKALHYNYVTLYLGYLAAGWAPVPEYSPPATVGCQFLSYVAEGKTIVESWQDIENNNWGGYGSKQGVLDFLGLNANVVTNVNPCASGPANN